MVGTRWGRRIGVGIGSVTLVAGMTATALAARDRPWEPPPCPGPLAWRSVPGGTWWRLDPLLRDGRLTGQRLVIGLPGSGRTRWLRLPPESFAAGPFDGRVLVGSDDGRHSTLRLLDPTADCARTVGVSTSVIRRATVTPDRRAILEMRVGRMHRSDQGVFRRSLVLPDRTRRILAPIAPDPRFGPTWSTEFTWGLDGQRVAIQSCGAEACRTRVIDAVGGDLWTAADPRHGELIGLAGDRLLVYAACGGLPCPVVRLDRGGRTATLVPAAGSARLVDGGTGGPVVAFEDPAVPDRLVAVAIDGSAQRALTTRLGRWRLVPDPARAGSAIELAPGRLVLGPDGRLPVTGDSPPSLIRLPEVPR